MTGVGGAVLTGWVLAAVVAVWLWLPAGTGPWSAARQRRRALVAVLVALLLLVGAGAVLAAAATPLTGPWRWVAVVLAGAVTVLGGGAVTTSILRLAAAAAATTARVQRDVLRGGAWIGALERLALLGSLTAGWPEGLAAIIAVKGLARYPELRTLSGADTGAGERFIIGTFASLGWAAGCAWVLSSLL